MAAKLEMIGKAWKFGDAVNTDLMYPGWTLRLPVEEAATYLFDTVRPGWVRDVRKGDIVVAGNSFGIGSSRPVAKLLLHVGIGCVIADQVASLFLRNCINNGLPVLEMPGITDLIEEGERLHVDIRSGTVTNRSTGATAHSDPCPAPILRTLSKGGVLEELRADGLIETTSYKGGQ